MVQVLGVEEGILDSLVSQGEVGRWSLKMRKKKKSWTFDSRVEAMPTRTHLEALGDEQQNSS
jgi:hypothetical protein